MNRSTKTRLLLRDKYKVVHSDRLYRPLPDWTKIYDVTHLCIFLEEIVMINFNNYLLLNEIELVHIFFSRLLTNI